MLRSMATRRTNAPATPEVLGTVRLVHGAEELLSGRAVRSAVDAVRASDTDADVTEIEASALAPAGLSELTSPSLFATSRAVVIRGMENASPELGEALLAYIRSPQPDVAVVLVHPGGQKGRGLVDKLKKAKIEVISCDAPKPWELATFVAGEVRRSRGRIEEDAATLLVDAVGTDLRTLAGAVHQLLSDTADETITAELIRRYFAGRAQVTSFAVADDALAGRTAQSLEQLRWALRSGVVPVLLTSALASGLRSLIKLAGAPRGLRDPDLAREVGVPPWKLKTLRVQLRGWNSEGLGLALAAVARADGEVKGRAEDAEYALERMLLAVSAARAG